MQNLDESILQKVIKARPQESFKGTFGKIVLVGGNENFGGAIIMAATAAVYGGTGLVTAATQPTRQLCMLSCQKPCLPILMTISWLAT